MNNSSLIRKIIALSEVVGGAIFIVYLAFMMIQGVSTLSLTTVLTLLIGALNIYAGLTLWQNKLIGYQSSILAQALQLVTIQTNQFVLLGNTLWTYYIYYADGGISFVSNLGVTYLVRINADANVLSYGVGLNLIATVLLIYLIVTYRQHSK